MLAGIVDELGIFPALGRAQHQGLLLRDHLREADDGIQRRPQLVTHGGEEAGLGGIGRFGGATRLLERLLGQLVVGDVAHHGDDFGLTREVSMRILAHALVDRPAAHLDPEKIDLTALRTIGLAPQPELDAAHLAARGIGQRGEIGRAIGDMDAVEQAVTEQLRRRQAEHGLRRRRDELHRAVALMPRDHIAHVAGEQAIALLFAREQRHAGACQRLRAEGKARGIERRRDDAAGHQHAAFRGADVRGRQPAELTEQDQEARTGQREQ